MKTWCIKLNINWQKSRPIFLKTIPGLSALNQGYLRAKFDVKQLFGSV